MTSTTIETIAAGLTGTLAALMGTASVLFATAAGSSIDRYPGTAGALLAHGGASAAGAGVLAVLTVRATRSARERR